MSNSSRDRKSDDLSHKVYVGGLGNGADSRELESVFGQFGRVQSVWVARHPPGFAFVAFEDPRDASDAVRCLDGTKLNGKRVRVEKSSGESRWEKWNLPPPDSTEFQGATLDYKDIREAILLRNKLQISGFDRRSSGGRSTSRRLRRSSRNRRSRSSRSSGSSPSSCSSDPEDQRRSRHRSGRREKFRRERRRSRDRPEGTEDDGGGGRRRRTKTRTGSRRRRTGSRRRRSRRRFRGDSYDDMTSSGRSCSSVRMSSPRRNQPPWKASSRPRKTSADDDDRDYGGRRREKSLSLPVVQIGDLNGNVKFPGTQQQQQQQQQQPAALFKENAVSSSRRRRETTMTSDACSQTDSVTRRTLGIQCCRSAELRRLAAKQKIKIANLTAAAPATPGDPQPPLLQVDSTKVTQNTTDG